MKQYVALQERHFGLNFGFYAKAGFFASDQAKKDVDEMARMGVNWIAVIPTVMQETFASTRQFRDFIHTPTDVELMEIIDYIHSRGMRVELRPMLECFDGNDRASINFPKDDTRIPGKVSRYWQDWFASMKARSVYYAKIAQYTKCEMYSFDSELDHTISHNEHWKEIVKEVRTVYDGPITAGFVNNVSTDDRHMYYINFLNDPEHWFHELDMLGFSVYPRAAEQAGATVEEMIENLKPTLENFRKIAAAFKKPIYFDECSCASATGCSVNPWDWANDTTYNGEEQKRFFVAIMETFKDEPWWYGLLWWKWDEQNERPVFTNDPAGDKGFTVKGKPVVESMKKYFADTALPQK